MNSNHVVNTRSLSCHLQIIALTLNVLIIYKNFHWNLRRFPISIEISLVQNIVLTRSTPFWSLKIARDYFIRFIVLQKLPFSVFKWCVFAMESYWNNFSICIQIDSFHRKKVARKVKIQNRKSNRKFKRIIKFSSLIQSLFLVYTIALVMQT